MSEFPLHDAVRAEDVAAVKELIASGSNINQQDSAKRTPLALAAWKGNEEIVQLLLRAKANTKLLAKDAFTPFHFSALQSNSSEILRLLAKADKSLVNARVAKGNKTALHLAAAKGNVEVISTLLELTSDVKAKTSNGMTAADITKNEDCFKLLRSKMISTQAQKASKPEIGRDVEVDGTEVESDALVSLPSTGAVESEVGVDSESSQNRALEHEDEDIPSVAVGVDSKISQKRSLETEDEDIPLVTTKPRVAVEDA